MTPLLASLPLQLVCQFIIPGTSVIDNTKYAKNVSPSVVHRGTLPDGYIAPGYGAALLADLPLELVCKMLLSRNPGITGDSTLVEQGDDALMAAPTTTIPKGYVVFWEDRAAYKIYELPLTWEQARDRCISDGARLAITDSLDKITHIKSMKRYMKDLSLHVGIRKSSTTNEWVRVDNGLAVNSVPWGSSSATRTGNCAGISYKDGLVDYECTGSYEHFVCEIPV